MQTIEGGRALEHWHREGLVRARAVAQRFAELARSLSEDELAASVPGMDWTARDVVAHVANVAHRYTVDRRRAPDRPGVAVQNADDLAGSPADMGVLLAGLAADLDLMALAPDALAPEALLPFHAGQLTTLAGAWGNLLGELLAHGDDIARATGRSFTVDGADLEPMWRFASPLLAGWLTPAGLAARDVVALDLGFAGGPVHLAFTGGGLVVDGAAGPVAHRYEGDAAQAALAVPYRRRPVADPALAVLAARFEPV